MLRVDGNRRRVTRGDRSINLTPKEFALLEVLLRRHDEVVPRPRCAAS